MHIAIVTAGGAGMFCGSCMHDNTWARGLRDAGHEVTLIPTYTPIRVDEENLSGRRVFFGGINVYLEYRSRIWRRLPRRLTRWVDHPRLIDLATRFSVSNDAGELGDLTLAMLDGESGPQRQDVEELAAFIGDDLQPDIVCFSNALLAGALRSLKERFAGPVMCTLQGDDIFLDSLPGRDRAAVIEKMSERARDFDAFIVHSNFYRDRMSELLQLPAQRFHRIPLGIDFEGHDGRPKTTESNPFRIGYFARVCPEKGLHCLIDAVGEVRKKHPQVTLVAGGFLGPRDRKYFKRITQDAAKLGIEWVWAGSPKNHAEKVKLLKSFDVLSVPTVYREPKGLYVLEAMANGIPVVQPDHGAFPEMLEEAPGGILFDPDSPADLASQLNRLIEDRDLRSSLAMAGYEGVRTQFSMERMTDTTLAIFQAALRKANSPPEESSQATETA